MEVIIMTVTYKEYAEDKKSFFEKHDYDFTCDTTGMNQYGEYSKTYIFADGARWLEHMGTEYCKTTAVVMKAKVEVEVKMFRTEYYSSENAESKRYYEKF